MNTNYISIIALVVGVFFSGIYVRGEGARKQEIKRELDAIRQRQDEIVATVAEINRVTAEKDSLLLNRIASARTYIDRLDDKKAYSVEQIESFGQELTALQSGIDSSMAAIQPSGAFSVAEPAVVVEPAGQ
ncbi:MAG: hypothetical protein R2834_00760 [Rhodothermales bacterium]